MAFNPNKNYASAIDEAIKSGASKEAVAQLQAERNEKIAANQAHYDSLGISSSDKYGSAASNYVNNGGSSGSPWQALTDKVGGGGVSFDPSHNVLNAGDIAGTSIGSGAPAEVNGWGLLDIGIGYPDKVEVRDGVIVNGDLGSMPGYVSIGGTTFKVNGNKLEALDADTAARLTQNILNQSNEYQENVRNINGGGSAGNGYLDTIIAQATGRIPTGSGIDPYAALGLPAINLQNGASVLASLQGAAPPEYEGSKWDNLLNQLAMELMGMNYTDWTKGDQYAALAKRYGNSGQMAMKDVLGQISSRTGGLASSYATTAANQQFNEYMSKLEEAARQMFDSERASKLSDAQFARQMAGDDWDKYLSRLSQWNTDRNFNYGVYRDSVDDAWRAQTYADSRSDYADSRSDKERAQAENKAAMLAAFGDFSGYRALGYSDAEIAAMEAGYAKQNAPKKSGGSGGGSGSGSKVGTGSGDYDALFAAARDSGNPQSYITNNYKNHGFTSSSGLYNDYKTWLKQNTSHGLNVPDYDTVVKNSEAGMYGPRYGMVLNMVQNMYGRGRSEEEIAAYLEEEMTKGSINADGIDTILQVFGV